MGITKRETNGQSCDAVGLNGLLPCPFCGEIPIVNKRVNGNWEVRCTNENCGVIVMTDEKISKWLAIETWNLRAR